MTATMAMRRAASCVGDAALMLLGAYLVLANGDWWIWVADSAWRGLRAPADPVLGLLATSAAIVPLVAGVVAYSVRRRSGRGPRRSFEFAFVTMVGVALVALAFAAPMMAF